MTKIQKREKKPSIRSNVFYLHFLHISPIIDHLCTNTIMCVHQVLPFFQFFFSFYQFVVCCGCSTIVDMAVVGTVAVVVVIAVEVVIGCSSCCLLKDSNCQ